MRPLQLDYQRVPGRVPWLGLAVLLAGLVALALLADRYQAVAEQSRVLEERADQLARQSARRAPAPRTATEQAARAQMLEVKQANQVVRELAVPWNTLFNAVESSGGEGITLLALEPDTQKGTVKITGEAKDLDVLLAYVKQLATRDVFAGVLLQSHQVQREVAEKPLRFALLARWKGAAP
jgi:NADH:ubiquinone oxidoreductase subunit D